MRFVSGLGKRKRQFSLLKTQRIIDGMCFLPSYLSGGMRQLVKTKLEILILTGDLLTKTTSYQDGSTHDRVKGLEPEFDVLLPNLTVKQGSDASFTCIVKHLGDYKVAWIRSEDKAIIALQSHMVTNNHRYSVMHNGHNTWTLHIKNVQQTDIGSYICQVNTDPQTSQYGTLKVVVPADIIDLETSNDVVVAENQPATLKCKAKGYPPPKVRWKRQDGAPLPISKEFLRNPAEKIDMWEGERLPLAPLSRQSTGAYLCIANNSVPPVVSKRVMVYVHFKPSVTATNQLVAAPLGVNITIICEVQAVPKPVLSWFNKGAEQIILNSVGRIWQETEVLKDYMFRMRLSIFYLQKDDFREYNCTAGNSLGADYKVIKLQRKSSKVRCESYPPHLFRPTPPHHHVDVWRPMKHANNNGGLNPTRTGSPPEISSMLKIIVANSSGIVKHTVEHVGKGNIMKVE
ncbi:Lachesin [Orchesella cincta]|uniref:Lachesin n=1 Tax=Orchesella cincta TaxID=48709 RepID=A0A1D2MZV4_ORCCI|nr:Lachesin [Orchesella cincta]